MKMTDMKMTDMKMTPKERKSTNEPVPASNNDYPYGLTLHLDGDVLDKLGLGSLSKVGSTFTLHAKCKVIGARQESREGGKPSRSVELQMQKIGLREGAGSMEEALSNAMDDEDGDE